MGLCSYACLVENSSGKVFSVLRLNGLLPVRTFLDLTSDFLAVSRDLLSFPLELHYENKELTGNSSISIYSLLSKIRKFLLVFHCFLRFFSLVEVPKAKFIVYYRMSCITIPRFLWLCQNGRFHISL